MTRTIKYIAAGIGLLVVVLIALIAFLAATFDPNAYRDRIGRLVEEQTGRTLTIAGDIDLAFFPWLAVEIDDVTLGNAPGFGPHPFARLERVDVRLKLLPLLRREVEAGAVVLRGMELNLERDATGATNWDDLIATDGKEPTADTPVGAAPLAALAIGGIEMVGARIVWDDRMEGVRHELRNIALTTGEIAPGRPVDLRLAFDAESNEPEVAARLRLAATLTVAETLDLITLDGIDLDADLRGAAVAGGALAVALAADAVIDLGADTLRVTPLRLTAAGVDLTGSIAIEELRGEPRIAGDLRAAAFSPRTLMTGLGMEPPETTDPAVLDQATVALAFTLAGERLDVARMKIALDDTVIDATVGIANFAAPAVRFAVTVDAIDADRYLPPPAAESGAAAGGTAGGTASRTGAATGGGEAGIPIVLPLDLLRTLDLQGTVAIGSLRIAGIGADGVALTLNAGGGIVAVSPASANLYGGSWDGNIRIDARRDIPAFSVDESLRGVQVGPLLDDLMEDGPIVGTANIKAALTAHGDTVGALRSSLAGKGEFSFTDGAVKGINIAGIIRNAEARLRGRTPEPSDGPNQTDFAELRGTFTAAGGVVTNNDLYAQSPLVRINGRGTIDVGRELFDYRVDTTLVGTLEGQGGRSLDELRGINLPIRVQGSFDEPRFSLDLGSVMESRVKQEVEERIEGQKEEIKEKIEEEVRDRIRRLIR